MISVLRPRLNLHVYRCLKYANRQIVSGFGGSLSYITRRQFSDSEQGSICPRNKDALGAKYCDKTPPPDCDNSGKPPPPAESSKLPWILALLALGGLAGYLYFVKCKKEEKKPAKAKSDLCVVQRVPPCPQDLPKEVPYLLIGGGTASFSAFRAIKSHDPKAKVLVISNEFTKPYMRPPLSKELWYHGEPTEVSNSGDLKFKQWNGAERSLYYEPDEFYICPTKLMESENGGVAVAQGYTVKKIDVCDRRVILTDGTEIGYGECLIATGCSPKNLSVFESAPLSVKKHISFYRTMCDFEKLKNLTREKKTIVIIGSGFLGSELACALAKYGEDKNLKIYQIFFESGNMAKILPQYLSQWTTEKVEEQGVIVIPNSQVEEVGAQGNQMKLTLNNGQTVITDHVILCVGCEPNVELADVSGLETDKKIGGFVVNAELEARRHLFVAGDAACFYDPLLGRRRVDHHDHSVVSGRLAGENMVGAKKPFNHQSMFWSDLGPKLGYEGIGIIDSSLPTVGVFAKSSPEDANQQRSQFNSDGAPVYVDNKTEVKKNVKPAENKNTESTHNKIEKAINHDPNCTNQEKPCVVEDYSKGVIFYLKDDIIVGVLLWNIFNRINVARKVINEHKRFSDLNEVAKLFDIHS